MSGSVPGVRLHVFPDADTLFEGAVRLLGGELAGLEDGGRVVFPGGSTPRSFFECLCARNPPVVWNRLTLLTSDERCVPPAHPDSNARLLREELLGPLGMDPARFLRFRGEDPPERAAEKMDRELVDLAQRVPLFDLVVLGLGSDGHTASLFPAESWPEFGVRRAVVTKHPEGAPRLSLTPAALRSARSTWFLASGSAKAAAVSRSLTAESPSPSVPARMAMSPDSHWLLDAEAAAELPDDWRKDAGQ